MKIKMKDSCVVAGKLMEAGSDYDIDEDLAAQLIQRDVAVVMVENASVKKARPERLKED